MRKGQFSKIRPYIWKNWQTRPSLCLRLRLQSKIQKPKPISNCISVARFKIIKLTTKDADQSLANIVPQRSLQPSLSTWCQKPVWVWSIFGTWLDTSTVCSFALSPATPWRNLCKDQIFLQSAELREGKESVHCNLELFIKQKLRWDKYQPYRIRRLK